MIDYSIIIMIKLLKTKLKKYIVCNFKDIRLNLEIITLYLKLS
jgi:hypothetical protein